jgi:DNA invertase Pin-like site-specific DNA recombinase
VRSLQETLGASTSRSSGNRLVRGGQLALVAQPERAIIAERLGAGKAKAKANGRHVPRQVFASLE